MSDGVTFWLATGGWLTAAALAAWIHRDAVDRAVTSFLVGRPVQPIQHRPRPACPDRSHVRLVWSARPFDQDAC